MAYYPTSATGLNYITYPVGPTPLGVTVTASGSTNTKGSYAEITSSSAFACNRMVVTVQFAGDTTTSGYAFLLDIATGAAASETVIVPDLQVDGTVSTGSSLMSFASFDLPVSIAASTRIAARVACNNASKTVAVMVTLIASGSYTGVSSYTAYGVDASNSRGTVVDPGAAANTKGAYTQLTASSSAVMQYLLLTLGWGGNTAPSTGRWYLDIATGGAGSETVLIPDLPFQVAGQSPNFILLPMSHGTTTYIAASTRIAVRASCSITDATDRLLYATIVAGTAPSEASGGGGSFAYA